MTYCANNECPFKDCDKHPIQLKGQSGERWFANLDGVCERYISYIYDEVKSNYIDSKFGQLKGESNESVFSIER